MMSSPDPNNNSMWLPSPHMMMPPLPMYAGYPPPPHFPVDHGKYNGNARNKFNGSRGGPAGGGMGSKSHPLDMNAIPPPMMAVGTNSLIASQQMGGNSRPGPRREGSGPGPLPREGGDGGAVAEGKGKPTPSSSDLRGGGREGGGSSGRSISSAAPNRGEPRGKGRGTVDARGRERRPQPAFDGKGSSKATSLSASSSPVIAFQESDFPSLIQGERGARLGGGNPLHLAPNICTLG